MTIEVLTLSPDSSIDMRSFPEGRSLASLQSIVEGPVERLMITPGLDMWINEEGLLRPRLKPNFAATWLLYISNPGHLGAQTLIHGTVAFACHDDEGNMTSVADEFVDKLIMAWRLDAAPTPKEI